MSNEIRLGHDELLERCIDVVEESLQNATKRSPPAWGPKSIVRSGACAGYSDFNSNPKMRLPEFVRTPSLFGNKPAVSAPTPQ